jgi:O-antigen ligase
MFKDEKILGNGLKSFRYLCSEPRYQDVIEKKQIEDIKKKGEKDYLVEFENGCNTHPHNIYLEFMAELGLIGMILFSVIMFFCSIKIFLFLKHYFLNNKINDLIIAKNLILFGIFIQMFPLTPSGSFFNNYMMIIFHLSIGFYLSVLKIKR